MAKSGFKPPMMSAGVARNSVNCMAMEQMRVAAVNASTKGSISRSSQRYEPLPRMREVAAAMRPVQTTPSISMLPKAARNESDCPAPPMMPPKPMVPGRYATKPSQMGQDTRQMRPGKRFTARR